MEILKNFIGAAKDSQIVCEAKNSTHGVVKALPTGIEDAGPTGDVGPDGDLGLTRDAGSMGNAGPTGDVGLEGGLGLLTYPSPRGTIHCPPL